MPQKMKTMAAKAIQSQLVTASSPFPESEKHTRATKARKMPMAPILLTRSLRKIADRMTVMMGATDIMGMTRYPGPYFRAWNRASCPPAPRIPTPMPSRTLLGRTSSFHLMLARANSAQGTMLMAHTT